MIVDTPLGMGRVSHCFQSIIWVVIRGVEYLFYTWQVVYL